MITTEHKKLKDLSTKEMTLMNRGRITNFGKTATKNWKKDYPLSSVVLFVKNKSKIKAFLVLQPITINYLNKKYKIFGICSVIAIEKGKNYGKLLIESMIAYLKETKKISTRVYYTNNIL